MLGKVIVEVCVEVMRVVHILAKDVVFEVLEKVAEVKAEVSGFSAGIAVAARRGGAETVIVASLIFVTEYFVRCKKFN